MTEEEKARALAQIEVLKDLLLKISFVADVKVLTWDDVEKMKEATHG